MSCIIPRHPLTLPSVFYPDTAIIVATTTRERALTNDFVIDCDRVVVTSARKGSYTVQQLKQIANHLGINIKGAPNKPELVRLIRELKCP